MIYDILIIGGGPIGLACGLEAKAKGLTYVIIEKGCLVNSLYNYPANMTFFSTSDKLEIGGIPFISNNVKPTRSEALEYYRRVAMSNNLNVQLFESVQEFMHTEALTTVVTNKQAYQARNIVIATGFYDIPVLLDIPGEDLPKVRHYFDEPHFYAMQKVVVVGAHNSAVDAALETYRKGADVTMVIREAAFTERVKYWVKPDIENRVKAGEIKAYFNSNLKAVRELEVDIETPDGLITIANDFVLAMTGYRPDFGLLQKIGIRFSNDGKMVPEYDPATQETNLPHVFLAGVVCGGLDTRQWFIENSRVHAKVVVERVVGYRK